MTPDEYQTLALRTESTPNFVMHADIFSDASMSRLIHAIMGVNTESGELTDMVKKHLMYGKKLDAINIIEEIGDIFWYCALALDAAGFNLSDCMERNIRKLQIRYPEKFTSEQALVRDLDAERAELEDGPDVA